MIEEQAVVVAGNDDGSVEVEAVRGGGCGSCHGARGCGISLLDRIQGRRPLRLRVVNRIGAGVGDQVVVGVPEGALLRAAASVYLVPPIGLILGGVCGDRFAVLSGLWLPGPASLVGGFIGFALVFGWVRRYSTRLAADARFRPMLLRRQAAVVAELEHH